MTALDELTIVVVALGFFVTAAVEHLVGVAEREQPT